MAQAAQQGQDPAGEVRRKVQTEGKWRKCENPACGQSLFVGDIEKHLHCCKFCGHHFRMGARQRLDLILDPGSWMELFGHLAPADPLRFTALRSYEERVREAQQNTGLLDAAICGEGRIERHPVVVGAMDFRFIGASMGSVVGEKVTRASEHATAQRWPLILFCCSGGARMDEGALSLMQMAKTTAAIARHAEAGLPYIAVLTDPTLAGVSASFAFLGDVILAEPGAMIGFTGARVIEQTLKAKLPEGFQEAEFLLAHGQIDKVVPRKEMRAMLARLLEYAVGPAPCAPPAEPVPAAVGEEARPKAARRAPGRHAGPRKRST